MEPLILITGGLGDIGAAIARKFLTNGWRAVVNDIAPQADGEARLTELFAGETARVCYYAADNADRQATQAMVEAVVHERGVPTVAAVNAAIVEPAPFLEMTAENWQRHLDVNLTGAFHVAQAVAQEMARTGGGSIVFTGSWVQDVPSRNIGAYCVSKAGLKMLARQMALELAPCGIRVNIIAPGIVDAGLSGRMFRSGQADPAPFERAIPLHRLQTAEEVADAFWLLAQPEAAYVTGATLLCDGGMSLFNWQDERIRTTREARRRPSG